MVILRLYNILDSIMFWKLYEIPVFCNISQLRYPPLHLPTDFYSHSLQEQFVRTLQLIHFVLLLFLDQKPRYRVTLKDLDLQQGTREDLI